MSDDFEILANTTNLQLSYNQSIIPNNIGKKWLENDIKVLMNKMHNKVYISDIAQYFQRTEKAIKYKAMNIILLNINKENSIESLCAYYNITIEEINDYKQYKEQQKKEKQEKVKDNNNINENKSQINITINISNVIVSDEKQISNLLSIIKETINNN